MVRWALSEVRRREGRRQGWPADSGTVFRRQDDAKGDAKETDWAWPQQQHAEASHRSGPV